MENNHIKRKGKCASNKKLHTTRTTNNIYLQFYIPRNIITKSLATYNIYMYIWFKMLLFSFCSCCFLLRHFHRELFRQPRALWYTTSVSSTWTVFHTFYFSSYIILFCMLVPPTPVSSILRRQSSYVIQPLSCLLMTMIFYLLLAS